MFTKQNLRILHMNGFTESEFMNYKFLIYSNIVQATFQLLDGGRLLKLECDDEIIDEIDEFLEYYKTTPSHEHQLSFELGRTIAKIYKTQFIKNVLLRKHDFTLLESAI